MTDDLNPNATDTIEEVRVKLVRALSIIEATNTIIFGPHAEGTTEVENYLHVAEILRRESKAEFGALDDAIGRCREIPPEKRPFILLDGSSGIGKTQTALGVSTKFLYFVLGHHIERTQKIYKPFLKQSSYLSNMVAEDETQFAAHSVAELHDDAQCKYRTLGFLAALWQSCANPLQQANLTMTWKKHGLTLSQFIAQCPGFVMVLDEFPYLKGKEELTRRMKFLRALGRYVGVVILLGTDSVICNLVGGASRNESATESLLWCIALTRFPKCTQASLAVRIPNIKDLIDGLPPSLRAFFDYVLGSHRPFITLAFLKYFKNLPPGTKLVDNERHHLEEACRFIGQLILEVKGYHEGFKLGQVRLFQPNYTVFDRDSVDLLIRGHFANIKLGDHGGVTELSVGPSSSTLANFAPKAAFPTAEKEALLYLSLMRTTDSLPFGFEEEGKERVSTNKALFHRFGDSWEIDLRNSEAKKNDPNVTEALLATAMCVASHSGGFEGVEVDDFFSALLFELGGGRRDVSLQLSKLLPKGRVPFMSPCNSSWPAVFRDVPGVVTALLRRPKDAEQIDLQCTGSGIVLTGECKHAERNPSLIDILQKIPEYSQFHFILTKRPYKWVVDESQLHGFNVQKLKSGGDSWFSSDFAADQDTKGRPVLLMDMESLQASACAPAPASE